MILSWATFLESRQIVRPVPILKMSGTQFQIAIDCRLIAGDHIVDVPLLP